MRFPRLYAQTGVDNAKTISSETRMRDQNMPDIRAGFKDKKEGYMSYVTFHDPEQERVDTLLKNPFTRQQYEVYKSLDDKAREEWVWNMYYKTKEQQKDK